MSDFDYPVACDAQMVGEYPILVADGAGYFYDDVLEYRVWCYPHDGAEDLADGDDYFYAFETFEEAEDFRMKTKGAQGVLALIKQYEWIDEYKPGQFKHEKGKRIAEWNAELLEGRRREPHSIPDFFKGLKT
jgi:hypothetical protein